MWLFDFGAKKKRLVELQELLMPGSSSQKLLSEKELMQFANQQLNNDMRIMAESEKIIKKTKDIDTFNSRMKLIDECVYRIKTLLPYIKSDISQSQLTSTYEQDKISLELDFKSRVRQEVQKYSNPYYETIDKIEAAWSVLSTFNQYDNDNAKTLEQMCKQSIKLFNKYANKVNELQIDYELPKYVPAFVRLSMLYEKQKKYEKAIEVCVQAIQVGAYDDHTKGKMYGRLAKMKKKSGIDVTDDIKELVALQ